MSRAPRRITLRPSEGDGWTKSKLEAASPEDRERVLAEFKAGIKAAVDQTSIKTHVADAVGKLHHSLRLNRIAREIRRAKCMGAGTPRRRESHARRPGHRRTRCTRAGPGDDDPAGSSAAGHLAGWLA